MVTRLYGLCVLVDMQIAADILEWTLVGCSLSFGYSVQVLRAVLHKRFRSVVLMKIYFYRWYFLHSGGRVDWWSRFGSCRAITFSWPDIMGSYLKGSLEFRNDAWPTIGSSLKWQFWRQLLYEVIMSVFDMHFNSDVLSVNVACSLQPDMTVWLVDDKWCCLGPQWLHIHHHLHHQFLVSLGSYVWKWMIVFPVQWNSYIEV